MQDVERRKGERRRGEHQPGEELKTKTAQPHQHDRYEYTTPGNDNDCKYRAISPAGSSCFPCVAVRGGCERAIRKKFGDGGEVLGFRQRVGGGLEG